MVNLGAGATYASSISTESKARHRLVEIVIRPFLADGIIVIDLEASINDGEGTDKRSSATRPFVQNVHKM